MIWTAKLVIIEDVIKSIFLLNILWPCNEIVMLLHVYVQFLTWACASLLHQPKFVLALYTKCTYYREMNSESEMP